MFTQNLGSYRWGSHQFKVSYTQHFYFSDLLPSFWVIFYGLIFLYLLLKVSSIF